MPSAERIPKNPRTVSPSAPGGADYRNLLCDIGTAAGLDVMGVAPAVVLERARDQIENRIERNLVNEMKFTFLRPERSTNVPALVEGARSVIVAGRSYDRELPGEVVNPRVDGPRAALARYAWMDHYGELKSGLTSVASRLRRDGHRAVVFADDNSVVDRELAWMAGLGWYGKNANLLVPGRGSFFVLGCVVTTADLPARARARDGCGSCTKCLPACPTEAIVEPGVIDANRCLSWLLQKPGVFDRRYRAALGNRIYGCDDCQTSCPVTLKGSKSHATGPAVPADDAPSAAITASHDVLEMLDMDDAALDALTDRWYVHKREMTWVRRNLLIILGNTGHPAHQPTVSTIRRYLRHGEPVLRAHAVWAAARLGLVADIEEMRSDGVPHEPMVADELSNLPALRDDL